MTNKKPSKRGPHVQNPKSKANLVSLAKRSPKERKKIASKGGRVSAKKYNDNLKLQKIAQEILQSKLPEGELKERLIDAGISAENATHGAGMLMKLTDKVLETATSVPLKRFEIRPEKNRPSTSQAAANLLPA